MSGAATLTSGLALVGASVQFETANSPETLYRLAAIGAVVTAVFVALWFITRPKEKAVDGQDSQEQKNVKGDAGQTSGESSPVVKAGDGSVISVNQSGGITAGRVVIGHPDRTFGGSVPASIIERLRKYSGTNFISNNSGGGESVRFEDEIRQLLGAAGWASMGQGFIQSVPAIRGLVIYGSPESEAFNELQACLSELGHGATIAQNPMMRMGPPKPDAVPDPVIEITVGI